MKNQYFSFTTSNYPTDTNIYELYQYGLYEFNKNVESIVVADTLYFDAAQVYWLTDKLITNTSINNKLIAYNALLDIYNTNDDVFRVIYGTLQEGIKTDDALSFILYKLVTLVDTIKAKDKSISTLTALAAIADVAAFYDTLHKSIGGKLTDVQTFSTQLSYSIEAYNKLIDSMLFADTVIGIKQFTLFLSEGIQLQDTATSTGIFTRILQDNIDFFGGIILDGTEYTVYTLNTNTKAVSEYTNYGFNSFSYPYAAKEDGIYKLEGSDDDGTTIASSIKSGLIDFGTSLHKQVTTAYLGITQQGSIILKAITVENGIKKACYYKVNATNEEYANTRVKLGKGIKSRYWQFEVSNTDGTNFELDTIEVIPIILKRRKQ